MLKIYLPEIDSTNDYLHRQLGAGMNYPDGTVIYTSVQTRGRGQVGNSWEAEPGQNLAFSLLLKPDFLPIGMSFALSQIVTVAIVRTLNQQVPGFSIKWPNDIYHDDRKVAGILIENRLTGRTLAHSIVGVGINLNQRTFVSSAPNPVSVATLRAEAGLPDLRLDIDAVLTGVMTELMSLYGALRAEAQRLSARVAPERLESELAASALYLELYDEYMGHLYRRHGLHPYVSTESGEHFEAEITAVEPSGMIHLNAPGEAQPRRYWFKEVKFCLPCGVTKE